MSLYVTYSRNGVRYMPIIGELEETAELQNFLNILNENSNIKTRITFLDASILNDKAIEGLLSIRNSEKYKIYVVKSYLYSYLYKLGVKCQYVHTKFDNDILSLDKVKSIKLELNKDQVLHFLYDINNVYGYDYTEYQIDSIIRRIKISMLRVGTNDFNKFKDLILNNNKLFEQLFLDFSINTTEFFRDPEVFLAVKNKIFSHLNSYSHIRILCAGCSTGKEPYSLAILLKEAGLYMKTQIYATDINPYVIEEAKNGLYSIADMEEGIRTYRKAGGEDRFTSYFQVKEHYIKVKDELKKNILFFQHSLLGGGIINEFQLIFCRNVLIYFNSSLQKKVLKYLRDSLDENGFLVIEKIGGILQNGGCSYFNKYDDLNKIYRRK